MIGFTYYVTLGFVPIEQTIARNKRGQTGASHYAIRLSGFLSVHVAGAAERPGVYLLPRGCIVQDALDAAGGPTAAADLNRINLAADLEDGQRVYVPQISAAGFSSGVEALPSAVDSEQMININTAGAAELELLPGIGPSLAQEITDHRSANGLFNTLDDLLAVSGIGPAKVEQIRDLITFH
ncbi:MAG: ComEA family DNA-binding protein [Anaerolineales bacterium]